ncbi:ANTH-domain-containing protein [Neoconidiobolus thromboides FSU 785]|nr:ANTH-domain-containing protein [Neoconidiobolus thromboides FSU 785]
MNTAVVKATKHDGNIPKQKHVIALCSFSWENKVTVKNMLDLLGDRLRDNNWDVVYKTLIVIHTIMRDGCPENVFDYLIRARSLLDTSSFRPKNSNIGFNQVKNIRDYSTYLEHKVLVYSQKKIDFCTTHNNTKINEMFSLAINNELIDNINLIQEHLEVLLAAKISENDIDSHISLYAFKMLIRDMLKIYQFLNQGVITILKGFFDLDLPLAKLCLNIYKRYISLTEQVINYLNKARDIENYLQFTIPELKHVKFLL